MAVSRPETRYAKSGDVHVAYQVFGEGDLDLVLVRGYVHHVELQWESAAWARALERFASFARVIVFDRRGTGLSDPVQQAPTLEERMDDVRAVMDAAGSERAALLGASEGAPMSILFAAAHPERVHALVLWGGMARSTPADGYEIGTPADALIQSGVEFLVPFWGQGAGIELSSPSQADDPDERAFYARIERASVSPGMLAQLAQMFFDIDVRDVVRTVHAPTLILHRRHDLLVNVRHGRWLAEHMPNARLVEVPGTDHAFEYEGFDEIAGEIEEFLTGDRQAREPDRVLATVLFTDIVDSTRTASELGDQRWRELLDRHDGTVTEVLGRFGGRAVKSTGDGFLATFDGPARGVRCAREILDASERQGISVRAGLHTGECEVRGEDIGGIAVHIAARVSALAGPGEVLVSRTVKDLVAGSGLGFEARGSHELKGVPDAWDLYEAVAA
ncbi:MAG TPA: adenylate/guanylate cyclase domain-containing protein [Thermoleophilaceae bacterium]|nr:adenylate/guanylate cyclase domain-containing protein [Thermoleophilaceae bacterium]